MFAQQRERHACIAKKCAEIESRKELQAPVRFRLNWIDYTAKWILGRV